MMSFISSNQKHIIHDYASDFMKIQWLRLAQISGIGPRSFMDLINIFDTAESAIDYLSQLHKKNLSSKVIKIPSYAVMAKELESYYKLGADVILACDPRYPEMLREIHSYPPFLICRGNLEILRRHKVAIVGSRNASTNGVNIAKALARDIGRAGYVTVSGLAKGIDTAAHIGALDFGTIGVISCGIDVVYPKENQKLHEELYAKGLVVTEYRLAQSAMPEHFPQRNRIISGLSYGVLVVEAAKRSGTLITANYALEQNRELFAVPGSPSDFRCEGTNILLKQGAILVQKSDDIISELDRIVRVQRELLQDRPQTKIAKIKQKLPPEDELAKYRKKLLSGLSFTPTNIEDIMAHTGIPHHIMNFLIIELELSGVLERNYNNRICLVI